MECLFTAINQTKIPVSTTSAVQSTNILILFENLFPHLVEICLQRFRSSIQNKYKLQNVNDILLRWSTLGLLWSHRNYNNSNNNIITDFIHSETNMNRYKSGVYTTFITDNQIPRDWLWWSLFNIWKPFFVYLLGHQMKRITILTGVVIVLFINFFGG